MRSSETGKENGFDDAVSANQQGIRVCEGVLTSWDSAYVSQGRIAVGPTPFHCDASNSPEKRRHVTTNVHNSANRQCAE